jgi:hypothetical protein
VTGARFCPKSATPWIPSSRDPVHRPLGQRVEYERWLLERALLDAKLIAIGIQSIGVHYERMVTDDPDFGAPRADTNFADYYRELRENVYRSREFMRRAQPGSVFNRGPKPVAPSPEPASPQSCPIDPRA